MLPTKTLNPLGRIFWGNCYLFLFVNSLAINSQKKLRICFKKIATQHKIEPLANPRAEPCASFAEGKGEHGEPRPWSIFRQEIYAGQIPSRFFTLLKFSLLELISFPRSLYLRFSKQILLNLCGCFPFGNQCVFAPIWGFQNISHLPQ